MALYIAPNSFEGENQRGDLIKKPAIEDMEELIDETGWWRYVLVDGSATILGCVMEPRGELTIPGELDGYAVTGIGHWAFFGCSELTSVTIPDSVISIGHEAFAWCWGLIDVNIPNGVTSIGILAFRECKSLTSITIPASVTDMEHNPFAYNAMTSIHVSPGNPVYADIDGVLFDKQQKALISYPGGREGPYIIPEGVLHIYHSAFTDAAGLTGVTIPDGVISIGNHAFEGSGLTSVTIPASVTSIGSNPFMLCPLSHIGVSPDNPIFQQLDGVLLDKQQRRLVAYPMAREGTYTIPEGVQHIGDIAFAYCHNLTGVTIPASVTSIGLGAFMSCTGLTSITIPNSVTSIDDHAFNYCTGLTSVTISNSLPSIGYKAFNRCYELISVTIPNSVTSIGEEAFYLCSNLTSVTIPASVTSIGDFAFHTTIAEDEYVPLDNVFFRIEKSSFAEQYAKDNGIPFVYAE